MNAILSIIFVAVLSTHAHADVDLKSYAGLYEPVVSGWCGEFVTVSGSTLNFKETVPTRTNPGNIRSCSSTFSLDCSTQGECFFGNDKVAVLLEDGSISLYGVKLIKVSKHRSKHK